jgi:hypothetical protein
MATYTELREAYIKGMTALAALKGVLSRELLVTQSNAWYEVKQLADRAHYQEWAIANPDAVKALEITVVEHEASFENYTDDQWAEDAFYYDYHSQYPSPRDFGYKEADWPDFGI